MSNPGFGFEKEKATICAACKHVRRKNEADVVIDPQFWKCDVNRTVDLVSGKVTRRYCNALNNGNCAQYEEETE
jgi:hypothetical protein